MNERTSNRSDPIEMDPLALSARGEHRREEMLTALHGAMRARKRRSTIVRTTSAAASLCLIAACGWLAFRAAPDAGRPIATDDRRETLPEALPQTQPQPRLTQIVTTDPTILTRLSVSTEPSRVQRIDDRDLIEAMRQAGQNVGVSRIGTEVRLIANSTK